jgi:type IV pilus assembly protein PilF
MTNAGVCMASKPDYVLAEQYFRDALTFRSSYGEALLQLAALKFRTEDYLRARAFLQRYMSTHPDSPPVLYLAVQIEQAQGDDRAATDFMNKLLRDFPQSAEAKYLVETGLNK